MMVSNVLALVFSCSLILLFSYYGTPFRSINTFSYDIQPLCNLQVNKNQVAVDLGKEILKIFLKESKTMRRR